MDAIVTMNSDGDLRMGITSGGASGAFFLSVRTASAIRTEQSGNSNVLPGTRRAAPSIRFCPDVCRIVLLAFPAERVRATPKPAAGTRQGLALPARR